MPTQPPELDDATHRALGAGLYNRTWDLMAAGSRTPRQDDEMLLTASASAWHWLQVGNDANLARSHWLLARVYSILERGEPAVYHAGRCVAIVDAGGEGFEDWDAAGAAEAMTRALSVRGDRDAAARWRARTIELLAGVQDADDRDPIEADLQSIPE